LTGKAKIGGKAWMRGPANSCLNLDSLCESQVCWWLGWEAFQYKYVYRGRMRREDRRMIKLTADI